MTLDYNDRFLFTGRDGALYCAEFDPTGEGFYNSGQHWIVFEAHLERWGKAYPTDEEGSK